VTLQIFRIRNVTHFKCHWFLRGEKKYLWICQKAVQALGHATAHVTCKSLTTEAQVSIPGQPSRYGICDKDCRTGTGFSPIVVVYSCQYYSISAPYSYFIHLPLMLYDLHAWEHHWISCCLSHSPPVTHQETQNDAGWCSSNTWITARTQCILIEVPHGFFFSLSSHQNELWQLRPNPSQFVICQSPYSLTLCVV
jgi:hypothetical protein